MFKSFIHSAALLVFIFATVVAQDLQAVPPGPPVQGVPSVQNGAPPVQFAAPVGGQQPNQQEFLLGVTGQGVPGQGIRIDTVEAGGPMTQMTPSFNPAQGITYAEPGDIIVAINGIPVDSIPALKIQLATLAATGGQCTVTIRNIQNGRNENYGVTAVRGFPTPQTGPAGQQTWSLRFTGRELPGQGIEIIQIDANSPVADVQQARAPAFPIGPPNSSLKSGDIITAINGVPVTSGGEYQQIMRQLGTSAGRVRLDVRDATTGQIRQWDTTAVVDTPVQIPPQNQPPVQNPTDVGGPRKIHVIVAGQSGTSQAGFNSVIERSMSDMDELLKRIADPYRGQVIKLTGASCTANGIMEAVNGLNAAPQDAIFFYYAGHGAQNAGQHYFALQSTGGFDLPRAAVAQALNQKNIRLAVMISESCNASESPPHVSEARTAVRISETLTELEHLLLSFRGFIDINSAADGQYGWGDSMRGGFFSAAFTSSMGGLAPEGDWNQTMNEIGANANGIYQQVRQENVSSGRAPEQMVNQQQMTPRVYTMQVQPDPFNANPGQRQFMTMTTVSRPRG